MTNRKTLQAALSLVLALCLLVPFGALAADSPVEISLNGAEIAADHPGVYVQGSVVTITLPGEYLLKGSLSDGQIVVDCEQNGKVTLFLDGVSVHCEKGPALYIKKCSPRLSIDLAEGSVNELSDGAVYSVEDSGVDAVIFSRSDLTITGSGSLNVKASYRDGIVSKDDLRFKGGKISVTAVHNGICGKDCVEIFDGEITVRAGNDGIKTTNEDADWGYITMEGGAVDILCGDDPFSFIHSLSITGGAVEAAVDENAASIQP